MPTRFDHAVIAVRDLDTATRQFQYLGFDAQPGGKHTGRGTHNALIRFGLDYVELLSVYDEAEARAFAGGGRTLLDELNGREGALVGFALATQTIEQEAERFRGSANQEPVLSPMQRARPDGHLLTWRVLSPGGNTWGKPWPFLIQWDTPDEQRLQIDQPGVHANGATGWVRVAVATHNLESAIAVYQQQLGLELSQHALAACQGANRATFKIGRSMIDLLAPSGEGPVQHVLAEQGEGPFILRFTVKDLAQTRAFLAQRGIKFEHKTEGTEKLVLDPLNTLGVNIHLIG
jgi:catechol 2,3-dioxygenase-like lactoylglutathione lyase family enzyme